MSISLAQPFEVSVTIRTYSPSTYDLTQPFEITDVINPNTITLASDTDLVEEGNLEAMRKAWETYVLIPHSATITHDDPDAETLVARAYIKISQEAEDAALVNKIQQARFPIPTDYTIALPRDKSDQRLKIIRDLVPFKDTSAMLRRMESSLQLPIATVRLKSQIINTGPKSRMN